MWLRAGEVEDLLKCFDEFKMREISGIAGKPLAFIEYLLHGVGWLVTER
jgi:hypothetical protein